MLFVYNQYMCFAVYKEGDCYMQWITNEVLFYGGIIFAGGSLLLAIIYFCVVRIKFIKLNAQLDTEYGEQDKK